MRVAALFDIHGNLPALEAVLSEVDRRQPDAIVVGGDFVSGPMPGGVLAALRAWGDRVRYLRGNGEREVLELMAGRGTSQLSAYAARVLASADRDFLAALPLTLSLPLEAGGEALFCHATPRSDSEIFTATTPAEIVGPMLAGTHARLVVCGHTHRQFDRRVDGVRVVNAGSVGMPNEETGAFWAWLGPEVELVRTAYDLEAAAARIRISGWELAEEFATENVLTVPSREQVEEYLASLAREPDQVNGSMS